MQGLYNIGLYNNTMNWTPLGSAGTLGGISNATNIANAAGTTAQTAGSATKFAGFNNLMSGIGAGVAAVASVGSLWAGLRAADKADRRAREQLAFAKEQFDEENKRYKEREKERAKANKVVAQSASLYSLPMNRT